MKRTGVQRYTDKFGVGYSYWEIICTITDVWILMWVCTIWFVFLIVNELLLSLKCVIFVAFSGYNDP